MKTRLSALALAALLATHGAYAATPEDTDGNGSYSQEEMMAAYPDLTAEAFDEIDADGNGEIDDVEFNDASEAGMLAN
ncbi:EF-hand domain-containing protein [Rhodalgimonas zhirmunskyi]|uniref:EF-hand domain-containing protein n=1 Tax=Rhodalgimonas zhirmunskyi TaxID=2964767 RepID=A0AAJ1X4N8_9RHOB|nr:EF-hand domain-containing protein [Rhodoalgimonas zhirmunskyi]MDQ2093304.1 EF-hand domain-containing protein [Rhodoalgimonas zhirmunskyi]